LYRKIQHRNARRCSGGVILYYREHLKHGIEVVKNNCDTVIWIKLKHDFFNLETDIYIWGVDPPAYNTVDVDLFETLENDISFFQEIGDVFLAGDFNSRVGYKSDFILCDTLNSSTNIDGYIPDNNLSRASNDKSHNSHGLKLLDLCKTYSLRIVNGRIGNSNNFTFFSRNGSSVIDYLLTHEQNVHLLNSFQVCPINKRSDHTPLSFSMRCNNCVPLNKSYTGTRYKWDNSFTQQFRSGSIAQLPVFNTLVNNIDCSCKQSVNNIVNSFTDVFTRHCGSFIR